MDLFMYGKPGKTLGYAMFVGNGPTNGSSDLLLSVVSSGPKW
jgi:hypothetical protein